MCMQVCQRQQLQRPQRDPVDLHAAGGLREVRLQRHRVPEASHLRGHAGARVLRQRIQENEDWIPVSIPSVSVCLEITGIEHID